MVKGITIKNPAGKRRAGRENSKESYSLYDSCDKCPLWAYIEAVCGNSGALAVKGNPPMEILAETRSNLIAELAELSGNEQTQAVNNVLRKIYLYCSQMDALRMCIVLQGTPEAEKYLAGAGLKKATGERVAAVIKSKAILLNQESQRLEELTGGGGEGPDRQYYEEQLVILGKHIGFKLDKQTLTLSQYAAYLKHYKTTNHGRKQ